MLIASVCAENPRISERPGHEPALDDRRTRRRAGVDAQEDEQRGDAGLIGADTPPGIKLIAPPIVGERKHERGLPPPDLSRLQALHHQPERGHRDHDARGIEHRECERVGAMQQRRRLLLQLVDGRQELVEKGNARNQVVEPAEHR